jgi:ATP-dependent Clp protease adaptor protein ClpS
MSQGPIEVIDTPEVKPGKPKLKRPPMYRVILLNDDYTPMEFVVDVLCRFFQKSAEDATRLMLQVHYQGSAVCGIYPHDVAETKVARVEQTSREHGHPLRCVMEQDGHD